MGLLKGVNKAFRHDRCSINQRWSANIRSALKLFTALCATRSPVEIIWRREKHGKIMHLSQIVNYAVYQSSIYYYLVESPTGYKSCFILTCLCWMIMGRSMIVHVQDRGCCTVPPGDSILFDGFSVFTSFIFEGSVLYQPVHQNPCLFCVRSFLWFDLDTEQIYLVLKPMWLNVANPACLYLLVSVAQYCY